MNGLLVDTDVFVDHLRGRRRIELPPVAVHFSSITGAELFADPPAQLDAVRTLLAPFSELGLGPAEAELGGRIKREVSIPLPDALIAATALAAQLTLLTRNLRHFDRVSGLRVRAPG